MEDGTSPRTARVTITGVCDDSSQRESKWSGTQVEEPFRPFSRPIRQLFQQDTVRTSLSLDATPGVSMRMGVSSISALGGPDGRRSLKSFQLGLLYQ
jgi:hypothetical protein